MNEAPGAATVKSRTVKKANDTLYNTVNNWQEGVDIAFNSGKNASEQAHLACIQSWGSQLICSILWQMHQPYLIDLDV